MAQLEQRNYILSQIKQGLVMLTLVKKLETKKIHIKTDNINQLASQDYPEELSKRHLKLKLHQIKISKQSSSI